MANHNQYDQSELQGFAAEHPVLTGPVAVTAATAFGEGVGFLQKHGSEVIAPQSFEATTVGAVEGLGPTLGAWALSTSLGIRANAEQHAGHRGRAFFCRLGSVAAAFVGGAFIDGYGERAIVGHDPHLGVVSCTLGGIFGGIATAMNVAESMSIHDQEQSRYGKY